MIQSRIGYIFIFILGTFVVVKPAVLVIFVSSCTVCLTCIISVILVILIVFVLLLTALVLAATIVLATGTAVSAGTTVFVVLLGRVFVVLLGRVPIVLFGCIFTGGILISCIFFRLFLFGFGIRVPIIDCRIPISFFLCNQ